MSILTSLTVTLIFSLFSGSTSTCFGIDSTSVKKHRQVDIMSYQDSFAAGGSAFYQEPEEEFSEMAQLLQAEIEAMNSTSDANRDGGGEDLFADGEMVQENGLAGDSAANAIPNDSGNALLDGDEDLFADNEIGAGKSVNNTSDNTSNDNSVCASSVSTNKFLLPSHSSTAGHLAETSHTNNGGNMGASETVAPVEAQSKKTRKKTVGSAAPGKAAPLTGTKKAATSAPKKQSRAAQAPSISSSRVEAHPKENEPISAEQRMLEEQHGLFQGSRENEENRIRQAKAHEAAHRQDQEQAAHEQALKQAAQQKEIKIARQREVDAIRQREAEAARQREPQAARQKEIDAARQQEAEAARKRGGAMRQRVQQAPSQVPAAMYAPFPSQGQFTQAGNAAAINPRANVDNGLNISSRGIPAMSVGTTNGQQSRQEMFPVPPVPPVPPYPSGGIAATQFKHPQSSGFLGHYQAPWALNARNVAQSPQKATETAQSTPSTGRKRKSPTSADSDKTRDNKRSRAASSASASTPTRLGPISPAITDPFFSTVQQSTGSLGAMAPIPAPSMVTSAATPATDGSVSRLIADAARDGISEAAKVIFNECRNYNTILGQPLMKDTFNLANQGTKFRSMAALVLQGKPQSPIQAFSRAAHGFFVAIFNEVVAKGTVFDQELMERHLSEEDAAHARSIMASRYKAVVSEYRASFEAEVDMGVSTANGHTARTDSMPFQNQTTLSQCSFKPALRNPLMSFQNLSAPFLGQATSLQDQVMHFQQAGMQCQNPAMAKNGSGGVKIDSPKGQAGPPSVFRNAVDAFAQNQNGMGCFPQGYVDASNAFPQGYSTNPDGNDPMLGTPDISYTDLLSLRDDFDFGDEVNVGDVPMSLNSTALQQTVGPAQPSGQLKANQPQQTGAVQNMHTNGSYPHQQPGVMYGDVEYPSQQPQPVNGNGVYGDGIASSQQAYHMPAQAPVQGNVPMQGGSSPSQISETQASTPEVPQQAAGGAGGKKKKAYKPRAKKAPASASSGKGGSVLIPNTTYSFLTGQFTLHIKENGKLRPTISDGGNAQQLARLEEFKKVVERAGRHCPTTFVFALNQSNEENLAELEHHLRATGAGLVAPRMI